MTCLAEASYMFELVYTTLTRHREKQSTLRWTEPTMPHFRNRHTDHYATCIYVYTLKIMYISLKQEGKISVPVWIKIIVNCLLLTDCYLQCNCNQHTA